jgi:hypothetical protein
MHFIERNLGRTWTPTQSTPDFFWQVVTNKASCGGVKALGDGVDHVVGTENVLPEQLERVMLLRCEDIL